MLPRILFPDATEGDEYAIEKDAPGMSARRERIEGKTNQLFTA